MPGLLRGVARTAVIAGTATSVSNRVSRRQANRWAAPVAIAVRRSGGQLVASGRIEIQAMLAALELLDESSVTN